VYLGLIVPPRSLSVGSVLKTLLIDENPFGNSLLLALMGNNVAACIQRSGRIAVSFPYQGSKARRSSRRFAFPSSFALALNSAARF